MNCFESEISDQVKTKNLTRVDHLYIVHIPCTNEMSTGYLKTKLHHKIIMHFLILILG